MAVFSILQYKEYKHKRTQREFLKLYNLDNLDLDNTSLLLSVSQKPHASNHYLLECML